MRLHLSFYMVLFCLCFPFVEGSAQVKFTATLLRENGVEPEESVVLEDGEEYTGAAPLEFLFSANVDPELATLRYEWNFSEDSEFIHDKFPPRYDKETSYVFESSGKVYVRLQVTDTETGLSEVSGTFTVQVSESELKIPNAFSPNGDGINDVFKVQHKSLIRFNATVFNRWGQKLYHWGLSEIDKGWDGGSVSDGVYFIVIEAQGADGVVYKHKGDINILR